MIFVSCPMKRTLPILVTGLICVLAATPAAAATKVFLLGGQSNMAGLGGFPNDTPQPGYGADKPIPAPYDAVQTDVKFWNYSGALLTNPWNSNGINNPDVGTKWVNLQNGFGWEPVEFGPEVSFGYTLHKLLPKDDIYLVKLGVNGSDLANSWNPNGTGGNYNLFKLRVAAAIQNLTNDGKTPTIAGMIWMQGEGDAQSAANANAYADNLKNLITHVRTDFNAPDMRFVVGRITTFYDSKPAGGNATVRAAEVSVGTTFPNTAWINTDDLERAYDAHYGTQGQIDLGIRFANAMVTPEPSPLVMAGTGVLALAGCYLWRKRRLASA
jgi:hypothetical protein